MTPAMASLLQRCIRADRIYRTKIAQNIGASMEAGKVDGKES